MLLTLWTNWWEDWGQYHKVTFDGENSLVFINTGEADINVERDLYSAWKEWSCLRDNLKFNAAMRTVGGDPTVAPDALGATFFMINGWKIFVDDDVSFDGNLFGDEDGFPSDYPGANPFNVGPNASLVTTQRSNLIDKISAVDLDTINVDGLTLEQAMKVVISVLSGKFDVSTAGGISDVTFYARDKTTEIVEGTVEDGIRTDSTIREDNL
jgi:hypothetical protein